MYHPSTSTIRRHRGFTLVELLVVIGIITVLIGILVPVVLHAMKAGKKSRALADFQTINSALEAYKDDCHDYPRFPGAGSGINNQWDMSGQRGAELLCRALIGPGPAFAPTNIAPGQLDNSGADGAGAGSSGDPNDPNSKVAGPGFRTRSAVDSTGKPLGAQGKVYGPYLSPDKFRVFTLSTVSNFTTVNSPPATSAGTIDATCVLLDSQGHTILYFPANLTTPNLSVTSAAPNGNFVSNTTPPTASPSLYNYFDNSTVPPDPLNNPQHQTFLSQSDFEKLLGDTNADGAIDNGETAAYTGPYILWSAGADGILGISPDGKSDNITNFVIPPGLQK